MRASQSVSVLLGSLLAVLAWRLAADVAGERGLGVGRARTLAIATGKVANLVVGLCGLTALFISLATVSSMNHDNCSIVMSSLVAAK